MSKVRLIGKAILSLKRKRGKGKLSATTLAQRRHARVMARTKPGGGERFKSLESELGKRPGIRTPGALAAYIGRKTYGKKRFAQMSAAGRRRA